jgi:glucan 1,3-beta-glucosidase
MLQYLVFLWLSNGAFTLIAPYRERDSYAFSTAEFDSASASAAYAPKPSIEPTPTFGDISYVSLSSATGGLSSTTRSSGFGHSVAGIPYPTGTGSQTSAKPSPTSTTDCAPYWLEDIKHQGRAAFNNNTSYQIFRNVKTYGAKGDGLTDDTAAIQQAIADGNRCAPGLCQSSTTTPAIVYFPGGTYVISASIIDYYYTQVCQTVLIHNIIC